LVAQAEHLEDREQGLHERADASRAVRALQRLGAGAPFAILATFAACFAGIFAGCYSHAVVPATPVDTRPKLLAPGRGSYTITRENEPLGRETFSITSSSGVWRVEGRIELTFPAERAQGYVLEIDETTREPRAMSVWIELLGERLESRGQRVEQFFRFDSKTMRGPRRRDIPYAQGTVLDFASPLFNSFVLSMLGQDLELKKPVRVRAIALTVPQLEPAVMVQSYELRGMDGELRKISVSAVGHLQPIALWVRNDGLPVRVRTWIDDGPPLEMRLD
jgi:hypothetical protein